MINCGARFALVLYCYFCVVPVALSWKISHMKNAGVGSCSFSFDWWLCLCQLLLKTWETRVSAWCSYCFELGSWMYVWTLYNHKPSSPFLVTLGSLFVTMWLRVLSSLETYCLHEVGVSRYSIPHMPRGNIPSFNLRPESLQSLTWKASTLLYSARNKGRMIIVCWITNRDSLVYVFFPLLHHGLVNIRRWFFSFHIFYFILFSKLDSRESFSLPSSQPHPISCDFMKIAWMSQHRMDVHPSS